MEDITDADYTNAKPFWKDFEINYLGEYHDLYVHSDTLALADVSENFQKMCFELDSACFLNSTRTRISMPRSLKKYKNKIRSMNIYRYVINGRKRYQKWNIS